MYRHTRHTAESYCISPLNLVGADRDEDREMVGRQLAALLQRYRGSSAIVLALPAGGIVVASELARMLRLSVDVLVAREFSIVSHPTVAIGGLSEGGGLCINAAALRLPGISLQAIWQAARRAWSEQATLAALYRAGRALPVVGRRPVILVDDGLGSGLAQLAALQALHCAHARQCIVATPGGSATAAQQVEHHADMLVALWRDQDKQLPGAPRWRTPLDDATAAQILKRSRAR